MGHQTFPMVEHYSVLRIMGLTSQATCGYHMALSNKSCFGEAEVWEESMLCVLFSGLKLN